METVEQVNKFIDLMFSFDMKELENETKFLEDYKKLQQENKRLQNEVDDLRSCIEGLQERINKAIATLEGEK